MMYLCLIQNTEKHNDPDFDSANFRKWHDGSFTNPGLALKYDYKL